MKLRTLIIDNYDSFTHILKQYFGELGGNPEVFFHDEITIAQIKRLKPTHIVLSPGPGTVDEPKDVGVMPQVIEEFYQRIPILGVCLGHQAIGKFFGAKIERAPKIMHGKRSLIYHTYEGVFKGVKSPIEAMRYHSLIISKIDPESSSGRNSNIFVSAKTDKGLIMGIQHVAYPVFGVQFHPESLGTKEGKKIIRNFLSF